MQDLGSRTTTGKALEVNLDMQRYGTFAEIGAGQEVARYFFQAGKASQTIAKTISAYDMIYSDEIYGKEKSGRYVCESRVSKMLEKEFNLLVKRLDATRGAQTSFFAFANTVATSSAEGREPHGWMGVRFQTKPKGPYNDVIIHVRMLDKHRLMQQESIGVLGVNLCSCAFYHTKSASDFISSLIDNLRESQISIDMVKLYGPDLSALNERAINLELVQKGWSDGVLFDPNGNIVSISDSFFSKALLIQRSNFRPVTKTHIDISKKGLDQFKQEIPKWKNSKTKLEDILPVMEITMKSFIGEPTQAVEDYSSRVDMLSSLGYFTLITRFKQLSQLKNFVRKYSKAPLGLVLGAIHLESLFDSGNYKDLDGGVLEGMGRLLDTNTKLYIYPHKTEQICLTIKSFFPTNESKHIFQHFIEAKQIVDISGCDEIEQYHRGSEVIELIQNKDNSWKKMVPEPVQKIIEALKLYRKKN